MIRSFDCQVGATEHQPSLLSLTTEYRVCTGRASMTDLAATEPCFAFILRRACAATTLYLDLSAAPGHEIASWMVGCNMYDTP